MKLGVLMVVAGAVVAAVVLFWLRPERATPATAAATVEDTAGASSEPAAPAAARSAPKAALAENSPSSAKSTNLLERLLQGDGAKLTPEQIDSFLAANHRSAESLLTAYRTSEDRAFLKEAMEKFPNDPRVGFAAIFKSESPEERRLWLDRLSQSAPDNALPGYLSALDDLKAGRTEQGVRELTAAAGKSGYQDYVLDSIQSTEEAYRSAGYSEVEAKFIATCGAPLPQLSQLKQLSGSIVDLASSYRQAGDAASAQTVLQIALHLGQQLDPTGPGGQFLINNLVGIAIQLNALKAMDPAEQYGSAGQTVQSYMDQITQQRAAFKQLGQQTENLWQTMPPEDLIAFIDREKLYGEQTALRWYLSRSGGSPGTGN
jgi:hypothetical protein